MSYHLLKSDFIKVALSFSLLSLGTFSTPPAFATNESIDKSFVGNWIDKEQPLYDYQVSGFQIRSNGDVFNFTEDVKKDVLAAKLSANGDLKMTKEGLTIATDDQPGMKINQMDSQIRLINNDSIEMKVTKLVIDGEEQDLDVQLSTQTYTRASDQEIKVLRQKILAHKEKDLALRDRLIGTEWQMVEETVAYEKDKDSSYTTPADQLPDTFEEWYSEDEKDIETAYNFKRIKFEDSTALIVNSGQFHTNYSIIMGGLKAFDTKSKKYKTEKGVIHLDEDKMTLIHKAEVYFRDDSKDESLTEDMQTRTIVYKQVK